MRNVDKNSLRRTRNKKKREENITKRRIRRMRK